MLSTDTAQLPVRAVDLPAQLPLLPSLSSLPFFLPSLLLRIIIYAAAVATLMLLQVWLSFFVALSILAPHEKCELFATFCAELAI